MARFMCPSCGCHESVCTRTIAATDKTLRWRRCVHCGSVFQTGERIVKDPPKENQKPKPKPKQTKKNADPISPPKTIEGLLG